MGICSCKQTTIKEPVVTVSLAPPPTPPRKLTKDYSFLDNTFELMNDTETVYGKATLHNLGNACAFNAILQAFIHTAPLADYFLAKVYEHELSLSSAGGTNGELIKALYRIYATSWKTDYEVIVPKTINSICKKHNESYRMEEQADAHEFFLFIFNLAHEDLKRTNALSPRLVQPIDLEEAEGMSRLAWKEETVVNDSVLTDLFRGLFCSKVRCLKCGYTSVRYDSFNTLCLPIRLRECSLNDCLDDFTDTSNSVLIRCPICKVLRQSTTKTEIYKAPSLLVIVLKRFKAESKVTSKLEHLVRFPTKSLDLYRYMTESFNEVEYELYAMVEHTGTLDSGHYTASVRNHRSMRWFEFDDTKITEIEESSLVKSSTYMLFYYNRSLKSYYRANPPLSEGLMEQAIKPSELRPSDNPNISASWSIMPPVFDNYEEHPIYDEHTESLVERPYEEESCDHESPVEKSYGGESCDQTADIIDHEQKLQLPADIPSVPELRDHASRSEESSPRGERHHEVVQSLEESRPVSQLAQSFEFPSVITRIEDLSDFGLSLDKPPSEVFSTIENPSTYRNRRQLPALRRQLVYL
jgi:ubiquitin C-terminal hydrolase